MRKHIEQHILLQRIAGQTDPAIAYALLTTTQLHKKEKEQLMLMLVDDLGLAYMYAKANQLLGAWPLFDAAIKEADKQYEIESKLTKLERTEFLDLYIYIRKVISGTL